MGRPKLLLPWGNTSVVAHLVQEWRGLGARQIALVCSPSAEDLHGELDRLQFPRQDRIRNPDPDRGMFSSIQCAAHWRGWRADLTHWIVTLGDQPHLRRETLQTLLEFGAVRSERICQPMRTGHRKHPVLFPQRFFAELAKSSAADLKQFLDQHALDHLGFESADEGLDFDLDTPADYERLRPRS